ncbi:cell division protease FtsH [Fistulifera solaris]|uniref:Cell division protease FtsH n=1 Tax=Fistulifera solaris TaxID=1519565 RepID=A0A1Z5JP98_FISSO|nr:cell division protease FtsH [Fistulifera solaris]|eukprot:GAX15824.1 cell division protease FtsH [Fistulifera solaris]
MKFSLAVVSGLFFADHALAFVNPSSPLHVKSRLHMAADMPPANNNLPVVQANPYGQPSDVRYSDFLRLVNGDRIEKVTFSSDGTQLLGVDVDGVRLKIEALPNDPDLLTQLTAHKVDVTVLPTQEASGLGELAQSLIFPAILFAGLFFLSRRSGGVGGMGGPGNPMGFGKSKAQIQMVPDTGVTFDDVAGCDGAKLELAEVVDFLKQPEAYTKNGCRIPRGVILDGPPGTGKTLLAKAVAGEAGVPFISISGSEFVEMFVGVGASRVRDIFSQARKNAPCIIFIDEIDAVGRQRGAGYAGGNDEREQTVNQILVEMDGFDGNPGIITIAATNRVDILDQALLRPGRFDRKVTVDLPDFKGRTRILGVHSRGKPLEPDVDLEAISRRTPGFSGAQLENLMNEAAIAAARANKSTIGWEQIDGAVDRIMVGLEKKGGNPQLKQKELVAYHEAGHAIVGALVPDYDQVQKISIIPRSNGAGGLTFFAPQESRLESGMYSRQYLESQLAVALGGRLAEELIYGEDMVTTGASNDIQQVANIAKRMVKEWGMSDKVGRIALSDPSGRGPFMGLRMMRRQTMWGNKIMGTVEEEVERLVNNSYLIAKKILSENKELLEHLKNELMEREVVSAEEFQMMLVQFKARTIDYAIVGADRNRDQLPFQSMPASV